MNTDIRKTTIDDAGDHSSPAARLSFDLRTSPERLQCWCEALERRIETLEKRLGIDPHTGEVQP
jgi:hypothetical protein